MPTAFAHFNLWLKQRRATQNAVVREAAAAMAASGLGLKAATVTPQGKVDVGPPNAILREPIDGKVILRTGRLIPDVRPAGGVHAPIAVVRIAADDVCGAKEWREEKDGGEIAYRTARLSRRTSWAGGEFSFQLARRAGARLFC